MPKVRASLNTLKDYLPPNTLEPVLHYLNLHKVHLTITRERTTVLGNYRNQHANENHRISINGNLNPYYFLITLLHELGHLLAFEKYGPRIQAHGVEWKKSFGEILSVFISEKLFPHDIEAELMRTLKNPAATTCAEEGLLRILKRYDTVPSNTKWVEELPEHSYFKMKNGRIFRKGKKIRKRFLCTELASKKDYLFSPIAEVIPVNGIPDGHK